MFDSDSLHPFWVSLAYLHELLQAFYFQSVAAYKNIILTVAHYAHQQLSHQISATAATAANALPATFFDMSSFSPTVCTSYIECVFQQMKAIEWQPYETATFPIKSTYINDSDIPFVHEDYLADFSNNTSLPELSASLLSCALASEISPLSSTHRRHRPHPGTTTIVLSS
jgi:hypothetical protein